MASEESKFQLDIGCQFDWHRILGWRNFGNRATVLKVFLKLVRPIAAYAAKSMEVDEDDI